MYSIKRKHIFKFSITAITMSLLLTSCGGGGSGGSSASGGGGNNHPGQAPLIRAVTIDNAGTVPLVNNNATSSVIYIHNNTDSTISGITYTATDKQNINASKITKVYKLLLNKVLGLNGAPSFINPTSATQCAIIPAHGACPLGFTTPTMTNYEGQGSTAISANYNYKGKVGTFSQIINYANVSSASIDGVQIMPGGQIAGFGNKQGYTTVYAYGSGTQQNFTVTSLSTSQPNTSIVNGNVTGSTIQSGFVQAIEVSGQIADKDDYGIHLSLNSSNHASNGSFTSVANVAVVSPTTEPKLLMGLIPVVDTFISTATSYPVTLVNTSNSNITGVNVTGAQGITIASQCNNNTISAGDICTINYTIPQYAGNGTISASGQAYVGAAAAVTVGASQPAYWFNSKTGALLGMQADALTFNGGGATPALATVNVTNIGGFDVTNLDVSVINVVQGQAQASLAAADDTCTGRTLGKGGATCSYKVQVNDSKAETGKIYLYVKGRYASSAGPLEDYSRVVVLNYTSTANAAVLTVSNLNTMIINGNNKDVANQEVTITNTGDRDAHISALTIQNLDVGTPLTYQDPNTCLNRTLPSTAGANTCVLTLVFGPKANGTPNPVTNNGVLFAVSYTGGTITQSVTTTSNAFAATVNPNGQSVIIKSVVAQNASSGDGIATPYVFSGANANAKSITITYENNGTDSVQISGFDYTNILPTLWNVTNNCQQALRPNGVCTVIFVNQLATNFLAVSNVGPDYTMDLTLPSFVFKDLEVDSTYYVTPTYQNVTFIKVQGQQATVANSINISEDSSIVRVEHTVANAQNYLAGAIGTQTNMENYFTNLQAGPGCNATQNTGGTVTENCNFAVDPATGIGTLSSSYTVDKSLASDMALHFLFSATPTGGVFYTMTPQSVNTANFPHYTFLRAYVANHIDSTNTDEIVLCQVDGTTGLFSNCSNASSTNQVFTNPIAAIAADSNSAVILTTDGKPWLCKVGAFHKLGACSLAGNLPVAIPFVTVALNKGKVYLATNNTISAHNEIYVCSITTDGVNLQCGAATNIGDIAVMGVISSLSFTKSFAYVSYGAALSSSVSKCGIDADGTVCGSNFLQTVTGFPSGIKSLMVDANNIIAIGKDAATQYRCAMNSSDINPTTCATLVEATSIPVEIRTSTAAAAFFGNYYYSGAGTDKSVYKCSFNNTDLSLTCAPTIIAPATSPFNLSTALTFVE